MEHLIMSQIKSIELIIIMMIMIMAIISFQYIGFMGHQLSIILTSLMDQMTRTKIIVIDLQCWRNWIRWSLNLIVFTPNLKLYQMAPAIILFGVRLI
jgi:hypothetical protein